MGSTANDNIFDEEGFLVNYQDWTRELAVTIAQQEGIDLSDQHWEIIDLARLFYSTFDISPEMRPLVKWVKQHLGDDKAKSLYLMSLFSGSPAKLVSKISGLPKPLNCI